MEENITVKVNNLSVRGVLANLGSDKVVICAHGFPGGNMQGPAGVFETLSQKLQRLGIAVIRFNFRNTQLNDGDSKEVTIQSQTEDLKAIIAWAKSKGFKKIGVLGESLGGTIAVNTYDPSLSIVLLWYPALDLMDTSFKYLFSEAPQKELMERGYISEGEYKIGKN